MAQSKDPRDPSNAVRLGAEQHPLADLYFAMLEASWTKLIGVLILMYLCANIIFALLYSSCGDCVAAVRPGSFMDAFFFSVQTISTIGYGHLYPKTNFAEAIVTIESLCGLLGFALVTGLVFSKFSLPSARVLFSEPVIIAPHNGEPTVMFRVANARGNDIVEASVNFTVLIPETTQEGETFRRLHQLKLHRSTSPLFVMSWTVFHTIDEESPLFGLSKEDIREKASIFICSLTGLDGTFNTTVHKRHIYRPENLHFDVRFHDVIETDDQDRLVLNLFHFHKTVPLPEPKPAVPETDA